MIEYLQKVPLFSGLGPEQLQVIFNRCKRKQFPYGTTLFREKEPGNDFYIILAGSVKIFTTSPKGEEKILSTFKAGDSFGELALIDGQPRSASAATLENSIMLILSKGDFLDVLREHFDISLSIMQELSRRLRDTNEHVRDLTFLDSRTRVLKQLIVMANRSGKRVGSQITLKIALNYDELAKLAGVKLEVLLEVLHELRNKGILFIGDDQYTIDLSKLHG